MNPQPPVPDSPSRGGPNCWLIGGAGCLVTIALLMVLFFVGVRQMMNTKEGKQVMTGIQTAIKAIPAEKACESKLTEVHEAITRYRAKNGKYPPTIAALSPDYLPDPTTCHCSLDSNPAPTHPTFEYTPPTPASKPADKVLLFTWTQKIGIQNQTETVQIAYYYNVAGKEMAQQIVTDINGHVTAHTPQPVSGPG